MYLYLIDIDIALRYIVPEVVSVSLQQDRNSPCMALILNFMFDGLFLLSSLLGPGVEVVSEEAVGHSERLRVSTRRHLGCCGTCRLLQLEVPMLEMMNVATT